MKEREGNNQVQEKDSQVLGYLWLPLLTNPRNIPGATALIVNFEIF